MKTRRLVFNTNDQRDVTRASMLYHGFTFGGNQPTAKGIEVIRRECRILDKFEAILNVRETSDGQGNRDLNIEFRQNGAQAEIVLEQPEFDLLKRYFEQTPWTVKVSRAVVDIVDWLATAPIEDN